MPYPCVFVSFYDDMKGGGEEEKVKGKKGEGRKKQFDLRR